MYPKYTKVPKALFFCFSNAYAAPHGGGADHVDYGAYTGGYGAFGWYTDHPVALGTGH